MTSSFTCRSCGSSSIWQVLNLGDHPLANELSDSAGTQQETFRLNLVFCQDCTLVQIDETVSPERLFRHYVYASSNSNAMLEWVRALTEKMVATRNLGPDSLVMEAASNDGYLLQYYKDQGVQVLGIEPAENIADIAINEKGVPTEKAFFTEDFAKDLAARGRKCDVFHAHNVFAHVPDPNPFLKGIASVLKDDGVAVIEAPYVRDLVEKLEFDTIYHEHFSYFGVTAVDLLAKRNGLCLVDAEHVPIHGGSIRYSLALAGTSPGERVAAMLADEQGAKVDQPGYYNAFAGKIEALCAELKTMLVDAKAAGKSVAAYGASAKGSTLLNTMGVGADIIDFTVDRSPLKQGRYMPGISVPILSPDALIEKMPDLVLMLTWNFADEIIAQQKAYLDGGGSFLVPVPHPHLVTGAAR